MAKSIVRHYFHFVHYGLIRRAVGVGLALALTAVTILVLPTAAAAAGKIPLTVTFPDGPTAENGSWVRVQFDANGNTSVTGFRYSLTTNRKLGLTATADVPGGTAIVTLRADHLGVLGVYLGDQNTTSIDNGPVYYGAVTVVSDPSLSGLLGAGELGYRAGVVMTLEPGGLTATTDATGYYRFDHLTPGTYSAHAHLEQGCDLELSRSGISIPATTNMNAWLTHVGSPGTELEFAL